MAGAGFKFKLVTNKKEFKGAMHGYSNKRGENVAVGFTTTMAYVMEDSEGLYEEADIKHNIEKIGLDVEGVKETKEIYNMNGKVNPAFDSLALTAEQEADIRAKIAELSKLEGLDED